MYQGLSNSFVTNINSNNSNLFDVFCNYRSRKINESNEADPVQTCDTFDPHRLSKLKSEDRKNIHEKSVKSIAISILKSRHNLG